MSTYDHALPLHYDQLSQELSREGGYECDEYCHATTVHYMKVQVLVTNFNQCFSIGRTYNVGTSVLQFSKGSNAYSITNTSRYVQVRTFNLTSETTRQTRFSMQNVNP
jgi:hypothetical protein